MVAKTPRRRARLEVTALEDRLLCTAQLITDTLPEPYRAVAKVIAWWDMNHNGVEDNGEVFEATAAMIGPHTALTSAHVVYDPQLGGFATRITILPGFDGARPPLGSFRATSFVIPPGYERQPYAGDDLGVLNFSQDIGRTSGWFNWTDYSTPILKNAELHNIGYPGDTHSGEQQYFSSGRTAKVTPTEIRYDTAQLPVEHGSSGSPMYVFNPATGRDYIVGVHSRRIDNGAIGLSARITPFLAAFIFSAEHMHGRDGLVDTGLKAFPAPNAPSVTVSLPQQTPGVSVSLPQHAPSVTVLNAVHAELAASR
jgi:V8-like Glu-specific endopeptidase